MKRISRQGSRASWASLALAAPIAATAFFGSVAFALNAPTTIAQTQTVAAPLAKATPVAAHTSLPSKVNAQPSKPHTQVVQAAPKVHASTGASGARP